MIHSSEKEYYCKECDAHFKGPSFFKHLKSDKHYDNYIKHLDDSESIQLPTWDDINSHSSFKAISNDTREVDANKHAIDFMSSLSKLLDMYYLDYTLESTTTGIDLRLSISILKMELK